MLERGHPWPSGGPSTQGMRASEGAGPDCEASQPQLPGFSVSCGQKRSKVSSIVGRS